MLTLKIACLVGDSCFNTSGKSLVSLWKLHALWEVHALIPVLSIMDDAQSCEKCNIGTCNTDSGSTSYLIYCSSP